MKLSYSRTHVSFVAGLLVLSFFIPAITYAATPTFTAAETTANVTAGTNDQSASTAATQANVVEVKASRTLTVGALPGNTETITIGTCVVTYASSTGATNDELNCTDNAAAIDRDTGAGNTARTASDIAGIMRTLTNVSDTGHGALTVSGSGSTATYTTTNTEASATAITFTDGTAGDITSTASTTGVIPVAQINTLTISGTVDTTDVYTATLPTVGAVSYTVTSSDTTTSHIANGLRTAILASSGYAGQAFTAATSTNTVVFTAKVAGTGFTQTSSASNRQAVAQVVTFTPSEASIDHNYDVTINGTRYRNEGGTSVQAIVENLVSRLSSVSAISCTENDVLMTCTAATAGTSFTYVAEVNEVRRSSGGGSSRRTPKTNQPTPSAQAPGAAVSATVFTRDLMTGMTGEDVRSLQQYLNAKGYTIAQSGVGSKGQETTFFGALTRAAMVRMQTSAGITPAVGYFGPKTRAYIAANP